MTEHIRSRKFPSFQTKVLFDGTLKQCLREERRYRPASHIGWNTAPGGGSGSEAARAHMSAALMGHAVAPAALVALMLRNKGNTFALGHKQTPEHQAKIRAAYNPRNRGHTHTTETKAKMSAAMMGRGHPQSLETRAKISATLTARRGV
jgi:hypothetical protein